MAITADQAIEILRAAGEASRLRILALLAKGELAGPSAEANAYFSRNAARWDEIRSLYVAENDVEAAIKAAAGPGPFKRLIDLGAGTGRMLRLLAPEAESAVALDLSQQMLNIARSHVA